METILAAVITGGVTLIGVLIANGKTQAVTETKLEELTREVRMHNNFAQRVPVIEEQLKVANQAQAAPIRMRKQTSRAWRSCAIWPGKSCPASTALF